LIRQNKSAVNRKPDKPIRNVTAGNRFAAGSSGLPMTA